MQSETKIAEFGDYEFRTIAINAHGRGLPSLPSAPIKVQEMAGSKPVIVVRPVDTASPYNKRAVITCEAIGRPTPTARWLKNGREVPDGARYRTEVRSKFYGRQSLFAASAVARNRRVAMSEQKIA